VIGSPSTSEGTDEVVVLLGPNTIRGPDLVDGEHASVAIECIDDRLALVADRVVPVERLWRDVMWSAVGATRSAVLVLPSWWPRQRSALVVDALPETCADVVVLYRADVLRTDDECVVVELADDLVALHEGHARPAALPRNTDAADTSAAVVDRIESPSSVVIDAPSGVAGACIIGEQIARALRARGTAVSVADDGAVLRAVGMARQRRHLRRGNRFVQPRALVVAASALAVVALAGAAVGSGADDPVVAESTWVVEGRVSVEVPAHWKVERVTTGPGSVRLQVVSPSDPQAAIHLTQSAVPMQQSLTSAAEVLRSSLALQPKGIFVDFQVAVLRADRPAIAYREVRPDHVVDWTVLLDGGVRIAIGCQRAPDRGWPESICERAIRSARVLA
jgi:type VII secretion-associated protein (TIGR03931 family)